MLAKLRWNRIVISADIEKAFLMTSIQESYRDMLRFLWLKDPFVLNSEVLHLRFCRLVGLRGNHHTSFRFLQGMLSQISEVDKRPALC